MKTRLLLHCDTARLTCFLSKEGEQERQFFTDLMEAFEYAATIVTDETPITVYDDGGRVIVESVIAPSRASNRPTNSSEQFQPDGETKPRPLPQRAAKLAYDAIALKAYFIALDRHTQGERADPLKDWIEAERQLLQATPPSD